jgi:2-polyprenyl-6-hydroxyphenyl methylase/3-demethylubiquinone-9 3-methyltransferase
VTIGERIPGGAPKGIHDPALFVDRRLLVAEAARHGVRLRLRGMRPPLLGMVKWLSRRSPEARMVPIRSTAVLFQGFGTKGHGTKEGA